MENIRVLQGVTGQAGQPHALAKGLRAIGVHAETCSIAEHKFGYPYDRFCDLEGAQSLGDVYQRIYPLIRDFDVFHFHARSFIADWPNVDFPASLDLMLLKLHGKKIFFHYRGQEIRLASTFAEKNPFHYVNEPSGYLFRKMPDASKLRLRDFISSICDGIFVNDPELQTYAPGSTIIPRVLNEDEWPYVGVSDRLRPLVVHAPSRRGVKGTDAVLKAATELANEGLDFELRLVENLSHTQAVQIYRDADVIIDQLRIGWYGVLAVEGMALGKPVVAYIRDDLWQTQKDVLPIVNANPETLKDELRKLIVSLEARQKLSRLSRDYFLETHSARKVAELLRREYEGGRSISDVAGIAQLLDHQVVRQRAVLGSEHIQPKCLNPHRVRRLLEIWRADGTGAALDVVKKFLARRLRP